MNSNTAINIGFTPQIWNSSFLPILFVSCAQSTSASPTQEILTQNHYNKLLINPESIIYQWNELRFPTQNGRVCLT